jgi:hypothetical protein
MIEFIEACRTVYAIVSCDRDGTFLSLDAMLDGRSSSAAIH